MDDLITHLCFVFDLLKTFTCPLVDKILLNLYVTLRAMFSWSMFCCLCVVPVLEFIDSPEVGMHCEVCQRISRWSWRLVHHVEGGHRQWWLCPGEGSFRSRGPQRWLSACCHLQSDYNINFAITSHNSVICLFACFHLQPWVINKLPKGFLGCDWW